MFLRPLQGGYDTMNTFIDVLEIGFGFLIIAKMIRYAVIQKITRADTKYNKACQLYYELIDPILVPFCLYAGILEYKTYLLGENPLGMVIIVITALLLLMIARNLKTLINNHTENEDEEEPN